MKRLNNKIKHCQKCPRMNIKGITENAPGYGNVDSKVILLGQSLCHRCMESQIPFTGGSGILLDRVFKEAGIEKNDLFITNVIHCHPPANRSSKPIEIETCHYFLEKEIEIVQPRIIIALGKDATRWFLGKIKLSAVLYRLALWNNILIYPTHHPSFIMKQGNHAREYFLDRLVKIIGQWI